MKDKFINLLWIIVNVMGVTAIWFEQNCILIIVYTVLLIIANRVIFDKK